MREEAKVQRIIDELPEDSSKEVLDYWREKLLDNQVEQRFPGAERKDCLLDKAPW